MDLVSALEKLIKQGLAHRVLTTVLHALYNILHHSRLVHLAIGHVFQKELFCLLEYRTANFSLQLLRLLILLHAEEQVDEELDMA